MPLVLSLLLLLPQGCGSGPSTNRIFFTGGTWSIPPSFHGNFWAPGGTGSHSAFVFEPLFLYLPATDEFLPRLATHWTLSSDRKELAVTLRKGSCWHDGHAFAARDVVSTYLLAYAIGWPLWTRLDLTSIEALSAEALRFRWRRPITKRQLVDILSYGGICYADHLFGEWNAPLRALIAMDRACADECPPAGQPLPPALATRIEGVAAQRQKIREALFRRRPTLPIGTGPFRMARVTADVQRLVPFPKHPDAGKIALDELRILRVPDNRMAWAVLISGGLDASNAATPADVAHRILELNPRVKLRHPSDMQEFGFIFNLRRGPTKDRDFRRAIAHVLDRKAITRISYASSTPLTEHATGILHSRRRDWLDEAFTRSLTTYARNPGHARELLEGLSYRKNDEGLWCSPAGRPLTLEIVTIPNSDWVMASEVAASQLSDFGISTRVRMMPPELAGMRMQEGQFDMVAEMGTDFRRYGLPEMSFRRLLGRGGVVASASGIADLLRRTGGADVEAMVRRFDDHLPSSTYSSLVLSLSRICNEELPFLPVFEKNLMLFLQEGNRVQGWPDGSDPIWSAASSGIESVFVSLMLRGQLTGVTPK